MNRILSSKIVYSFLGMSCLGFLLWRFPQVLDSRENQMHLVKCILVLCLLIPTVSHFGLSRTLKYAATWGGIGFGLLVVYSYHEDLSSVMTRVKSHLLPFSATTNVDGAITFIRADDGHFHVEALVNGIPIQFMVDTGASRISLTAKDAQRLGIDVDTLSYDQLVSTANGETLTAPLRLSEVKIGPIICKDINASVSKNMSGHSLLGMSFLNSIKSFKVEGERLIMWG